MVVYLSQEVVGADPEVARGRGRTLVFAASTAAADAAAAALADAGLESLLYHRLVPADDRAAALDAMRSGCASPYGFLLGAVPPPGARRRPRGRAGRHAQRVRKPIWLPFWVLYHSLVPADDRAAALDAMRSGCGAPSAFLPGGCLLFR